MRLCTEDVKNKYLSTLLALLLLSLFVCPFVYLSVDPHCQLLCLYGQFVLVINNVEVTYVYTIKNIISTSRIIEHNISYF